MEFLKGLVEAQSLGVSKEIFIEIWKKETDIKIESARRERDINWLHGSDRHECAQGTTCGNFSKDPKGGLYEDVHSLLSSMNQIQEQISLQKNLFQNHQELSLSSTQELKRTLNKFLEKQISLQKNWQLEFENVQKTSQECVAIQKQTNKKIDNVLTGYEISEKRMHQKVDRNVQEYKNLEGQMNLKIDDVLLKLQMLQQELQEKINTMSMDFVKSLEQLFTMLQSLSAENNISYSAVTHTLEYMSANQQRSTEETHKKYDMKFSEQRNLLVHLGKKIQDKSTECSAAQLLQHRQTEEILKESQLLQTHLLGFLKNMKHQSEVPETVQKEIFHKMEIMQQELFQQTEKIQEILEQRMQEMHQAISHSNEIACQELSHKTCKIHQKLLTQTEKSQEKFRIYWKKRPNSGITY